MSFRSTVVALGLALAAGPALAAATPGFITAAVGDAGRPAADKRQDANRKPAELIAFTQIRPGQKVAELLPGGGYFTRIFSKTVGPEGKVYVIGPPGATVTVEGVLSNPAYANVRAVTTFPAGLNLPEPVDVVWTSLNYHDLKNPPRGGGAPIDIAAFNKAVYDALKPGGYYVVIDHSAQPGDATASSTKHRIDQLTVVNEVAGAGFIKQAELQALRRPADPRTAPVFSLNGQSDQFVMVFRKPDLSLGGAIR